MPSMFPSPLRGDAGSSTTPDASAKPKALTIAYYLAVTSAIVLILSGLVLFTTHAPAGTSPDLVAAVGRNQRFMAITNIVGGIMIAALASQFQQAGRVTRRVYLGIVVLLIALNLIAVMLRVGGLVLMIISLLLALSVMAYFQQAVSAYLDHQVRS